MAVHLAIDVGKETLGLAVCDEDELSVMALYTISRKSRKKDVAKIVAEIEWRGVEQVVVGLATLSGGREGESASRARRIGELVRDRCGRPVVYQDEHLTTFEAEHRLMARGFSGKELKNRLDAEAAKVILEDYLAGRPDQARNHPGD